MIGLDRELLSERLRADSDEMELDSGIRLLQVNFKVILGITLSLYQDKSSGKD